MEIKSEISNLTSNFLNKNYDIKVEEIEIQNTKKDFDGDITIVLFPFFKLISKDQISEFGKSLGESLIKSSINLINFNIVGGFLNLTVSDIYYLDFLDTIKDDLNFGKIESTNETYIVEFSSPNTNKPLHLGHIRNILLGQSISNILEKMGIEWIDPWEKPLHQIYRNNPCLSPVPSLAIHCANINSVFGISPLVDVKELWENSKN